MTEFATLGPNFGGLPPDQKIAEFEAAISKRQRRVWHLPAGSDRVRQLKAEISQLEIERNAVRYSEEPGSTPQTGYYRAIREHQESFDGEKVTAVNPGLTLVKNDQERSA